MSLNPCTSQSLRASALSKLDFLVEQLRYPRLIEVAEAVKAFGY